MKLHLTLTRKDPSFQRAFQRVIQGLTNGMNLGDVLVITTDPETGRWVHSITRRTIGEELPSTLKRAIL